MAIGDFNVIYKMCERSDYYVGMQEAGNVQDFQDCIAAVGLVDLYSEGPLYTWSNKRTKGFVAKKFDRIMVNDNWMEVYKDVKAEFTLRGFSDHCAGGLRVWR